jgi:AraC-like DNA-binding protein
MHQSYSYSAPSYWARISPAVNYIHENHKMENIEISHLASLCHISEVYLRKLFHHCFHQSPLQYIRTVKISHAKDMLLSGEYTISETAELCGFNDASHFSRTFKKLTGLSPSRFSRS